MGSEVEVGEVAKSNYGRSLVPNLLNSNHENFKFHKGFQSLKYSLAFWVHSGHMSYGTLLELWAYSGKTMGILWEHSWSTYGVHPRPQTFYL